MLIGTVTSRRRRSVSSKNAGEPDRYAIYLTISTATGAFRAECWSSTKLPLGLPAAGEDVKLPVSIRSYVQGGVAHTTLVFGSEEKGESF